MIKDSIECYQAIASALVTAATEPWDTITVDATLTGIRVDVVIACRIEEENTPVAYLNGVPRLASYLVALAHLTSTEEKGLFKKCQFILNRNMKFDVNFIY